MVEKNDWRLMGQESWLMNAVLIRKNDIGWTQPEHEHCEFCSEAMMWNQKYDPPVFCTLDNYHWVCSGCYHDFKEMFDFSEITVPGSTVLECTPHITYDQRSIKVVLIDIHGRGYFYEFINTFYYGILMEMKGLQIEDMKSEPIPFDKLNFMYKWGKKISWEEIKKLHVKNIGTDKRLRHLAFYHDGRPAIVAHSEDCKFGVL